MAYKGMNAEYICTHLGEEDLTDVNYGAVIPPVYATSLHVFKDIESMQAYDPGNPGGKYIYGRVDNPTVRLLETKLAALEHADDAVCFASGMAAISSAIMYCVAPGSHVVAVMNCYGPTRKFLEQYLARRGVTVTYVAGHDPAEFENAAKENTTLFYLESPTSSIMELQDVRAVTAIAKRRGIKTVIDNTWATPLLQQPLAMGVDMTVHTMSKYIGGHSDIIGGVLCASKEIVDSVKHNERELLGGILGPFEAWLAVRGLRTMPIRLAKSGENALAVAKLLDASPRVRRVNYPWLESHPQHALAKAQMSGGSGLLSFEPDCSPDEAVALANRMKRFYKGVSWGGFESLVSMSGYKMTDEEAKRRNSSRSLIRIYCGLEATGDLLDDVAAALEGI